MRYCIEHKDINCENLTIKQASRGNNRGSYFFGCRLYPACLMSIPIASIHCKNDLSEEQKDLAQFFESFVRNNTFLYATYGNVYFRLRDPGLLDYLLKTDIIRSNKDVLETGITGARMFYALYYCLRVIPADMIRLYLKTNFPQSELKFQNGEKPNTGCFEDQSGKLNEEELKQYVNKRFLSQKS